MSKLICNICHQTIERDEYGSQVGNPRPGPGLTLVGYLCQVLQRYGDDNYPYRMGQALFSTLEEVRPDLAAAVVNTELDPFYLDERSIPFIQFLEKAW